MESPPGPATSETAIAAAATASVVFTQREERSGEYQGVKVVSPETEVDAVLVDGTRGFWIEGTQATEEVAMSAYTITVAGATGKTGRAVARAAQYEGWRVRAGARRRPPIGEWVLLDWDDRDTWAPAFRGSTAAYLLLPFNHPGAAERTPYLLEAASRAGVRRIVLLTSWDAAHEPEDGPLQVAEKALSELPVESAVLRPTWFLDNFTTGSFAGMTRAGELRLPAGDAKIPFVDVRDIASVAISALAEGGPGGVLPLTGPEAIDHHHVAAALADAFQQPISYTPVSVEEFADVLAKRGFSRDYGRFLGDALQDAARGDLNVPVADTVERVVGRRPYSVEEFAQHHGSSWLSPEQ